MIIGKVRKMPISFFKRNEKNGEFFEEKNIELTQMIEDVKKRGVLVPLIAKDDGILLAGHCRLKAAKVAGLKFLPVQIVTNITDAEEFEYLIKDNTVRRHFTPGDRLKIYRRLYPAFDTDVLTLRKISIQHIADVSGLSHGTVNKDITSIREQATDVRKKRTKEENLVILYRRLTTQILNAVIAGSIDKGAAKNIADILLRVINEPAPHVVPKEKTLTRRRIM